MAFSPALVSVLSGATPSQLYRWRRRGLLTPEVQAERPPLYSFRDLVVARSLAFLRGRVSAQRITKAVSTMKDMDGLTWNHLSQFSFGTDGDTIFIGIPGEDTAVDVLRHPGQIEVFSFQELFDAFADFKGRPVVDLRRPEPNLEVDPDRLGGWPTVAKSRVPYDLVAQVIDGDDVTIEDIGEFFPGVSPDAARDALLLDRKVREAT